MAVIINNRYGHWPIRSKQLLAMNAKMHARMVGKYRLKKAQLRIWHGANSNFRQFTSLILFYKKNKKQQHATTRPNNIVCIYKIWVFYTLKKSYTVFQSTRNGFNITTTGTKIYMQASKILFYLLLFNKASQIGF